MQYAMMFIVLVFLVQCGLAPRHSKTDNLPTKELAESQEKARLAVLDFQAKGIPYKIAEMASEWLRTEIINTQTFEVVERSEMQKIFKEQAFSMTGVVDVDKAVKAGKLLSAKKILIGSISQFYGKIIINGRLIDVEKGTAEFAHKETINEIKNIDKGMKYFAENLSRRVKGLPVIAMRNENVSSDRKKSKNWKYAQDIKLVYRLNDNGDIECASYDGKNCLWGLNINQISFNRIKPLACGEHHYNVWGDTGYSNPEHWCNKLKIREQ
jgi:TolB-like protein